jgi:hypothetical protein
MTDLGASIVAALVLLGIWLALAAPVGYLAHRRMQRVERELGGPAQPADELPLLLRAVAAIAWPVAVVVGIVVWLRREWARLARDVTLIFLAQITASVLSVCALVITQTVDPPGGSAEELIPLVDLACATLAFGLLLGTVFLWLWAGRRADRLRRGPPQGPAPGLWRFALYAASLLAWPAGIALAVIFTAPEKASVGAAAFRCSLIQIAAIALAVCIALPLLLRAFGLPFAP